MKKRIFFVLFLLLGSLVSEAQSRIIAGEYFWGTMDPGSGNGTAFTATDGTFSDVIESLIASGQTIPNNTSPLRFNVRVKDISNNWGPTFKKVIFLTSNLPSFSEVKITQGEYFFGSTDPGQGSGTQLVVFDGNWNEAIESVNALSATWSLASGLHLFNIRAKDGNNAWGPLFKKTISVQSPSANSRLCKIQTGEFFFGASDPGQGSGTALLVLDGNWSDAIEAAVNSNVSWSLANGLTLFNVRVKDESNNWGPIFKKAISVQSAPTFRPVKVTAGEFYFGVFDPGQGSGTTILAFDGEYNDAIEQGLSSQVAWSFSGNSTLFNIRFRDESNQWGPVFKKTVFRDDLPTARGLNITFAEYYFGVFDPGAGTGNIIVAFDGNFDSAMEVLLRNHLTWETQSGSTLFNIRVKDEANHWGPVFKRTIFFNGSNPAVNLISQGETISKCPTFPVTLNYAGPQGFTVTWEDGTTGNDVTFVPSGSGYFSVMANLGNEYLYDSIYVNVYALPPANITPAGDILVCASSNVMLTANTGTNYSYVWYYNDAVIPGETMINYLPTQVGAYKVRVTDNTTTCQQTSLPTTFYSTSPIFPTGTVTTACNPNGVLLTGPVGTGNTYQWKKNGAAISGATSGTYLATTAGNYAVTVTNGQCLSTSGTTTVTTTGSTVVSTISPSGTQSICDGGSVVLTASTGSGYTYQWNKDGVAIAGATSGTYTATTSGAYTVTVTATGCSLTSSATTVVLGSPVTPSLSIVASNTTVCSGVSVTYTATATNGGSAPTYQWKVNGTNATGATSANYSYVPTNGDVVSCVLTANNACQSSNTATSNSVTMSVNTSVIPSISIAANNTTVCSGTAVSFTSTPTNGGTAPTYQWKKNGVNISGATSGTYTLSVPANNDVITLVMTSNNACQTASTATSNAVTLTVSIASTPSVSIVANNTTVCSGTGVNFTATPTNGGTTPTYQWKKNGVNITGATAATYSLTSPANNDVITVVMTSNAACVSTTTATSNSVTITVTTGLTPSVSIVADASTVCSGTTVNFTATPTNGGTTPTYQWKKNGVNITGATAATYALTTPANGDAISVVLTSNASCLSTTTATSNAVTLVVNNSVTPTVSITAGTNTICSGTSVQFTSAITNGGTTPTYQWKKNGVNISGAISATYSDNALINGDIITLQLTSNAACASSTTASSNSVTMIVSSSVTPSVAIAADASTVCSGTTINFTATPTNGGTTPTYQWKKNGVNITGATAATYALTTPANGDVITVVMTSNASCASTTTATSNAVTITVTTAVTPSVSIVANNTTVCSGTGVNFTATPTNGGTIPTYQWKKNGVNITGATAATYALTTPANGDVITVVMTSNTSCASTTTATSNAVTITVTTAVTPSVSIVANNTTVCSGTGVNFTATPTNGGTTPTYQWKKNGVNITGATAATYALTTPANGDVITVVMTSNASCASTTTGTSNAVTITVTTAVTPSVSIVANNTTVCSGTGVNFTATPTNGGTTPTYQWKKNGVNITGATAATYALTTPANGDVITVVMTSNASCASTTTATSNAVTITVNSNVTYYADTDNDGYGNPQSSISACTVTAGYVTSNTDCNDNSAQVNPGAVEVCNNNIDDNCNAQIDENCIVLGCTNSTACNYNPGANTDDGSCILPVAEICNGLDDNCNNQVDEGLVFNNYYVDQDQDGYGTTLFGNFCQAPVGNYATLNGDCNDANNTIAPNLPEACNTIDDNCNGQVDEGVTVASVVSTLATTKLYPTCSGTNLFTANLNLGYNSPVTAGDGMDLWYKLIPTYNTLRAGLSAATGDNQLELYWAQGNCLTLIAIEHETGVSNQTLFADNLIPGQTYYVVCRNISGAMNTSAKICFNHFEGSTCDHYYSNGTGIYANVCSAFKAVFKGNAANYIFNVNSASINGVDQGITPWSYTTPTSNSIITRLGTLVPVNMGTSNVVYGLNVGVTYALADAAGNMNYFMANGTVPCTITLNPEATISLRSTDRCPTLKSVASSIAPDRTICGATRYQWEFTQVSPTAQAPVLVLGGLNSNVLFLNTVPGMGNSKTYNVRVRPIHSNGALGEWGSVQCLKTTTSGMAVDGSVPTIANAVSLQSTVSLYPNPSTDGSVTIVWNEGQEGVAQVEIWDMTGKLIARKQELVSGNQWELNVGDLSNGVYLVKIGDQRLPWVIAK